MKRLKYNIKSFALACAVLASPMLTSCEKWLNTMPSNQTDATIQFSTERGFQEALTGVYTLMASDALYGREMTFGMVDAVAQTWKTHTSDNSQYKSAMAYKYREGLTTNVMDNMWKKQYNAIANANDLLAFVDVNKNVFSSDATQSIVKGEALAIRAMLHFDMLRLYAPYDLDNTDTQKWLPYVTVYSKNTSESLSFKEFGDKVIVDLLAAEELLKQDPILTGKTIADLYYKNRHWHLNYYAVKGLQARVYLYLGDKTKAAAAANVVINAQKNNGLFPFVTREAASSTQKENIDRTFSSEHLFALNIRNLNKYIDKYFTNYNTLTGLIPLTPKGTLFEGFDEYRSQFFETESSTTDVPSKLWQLEKASTDIKFRMPMIRISEMYYIAAECETNLSNAQELLNTVRRARNITTDLVGKDTETLLQAELLKEYQKEFIAEGQLFYFHKRIKTEKLNKLTVLYQFPMPDNEIDFGGRPRPTV